MAGPDVTRGVWRTSSRSAGEWNCLEVAGVSGAVAVRDSKDRDGPVLLIGRAGWAAFLAGIRSGEFDRR